MSLERSTTTHVFECDDKLHVWELRNLFEGFLHSSHDDDLVKDLTLDENGLTIHLAADVDG
jgi:hypothetical protein